MSAGWSVFVVLGTGITLVALLWLLLGNRTAAPVDSAESVGHEFDGIEELDTPLPRWWVWLFLGTIAYALAYLSWYPGLGNFAGLSGWSSAGQVEAETVQHDQRFAALYARLAALEPAAAAADRQALNVGRRLFLNNCSTCHGVTGGGAFGFPDLTDSEWLWGRDVATVRTTISDGRVGMMPPWGMALSDADVRAVAVHVQHLAGAAAQASPPAAGVDAAVGAQKFQMFCVACHGADGAPQMPGVPDLRNAQWLYGGDLQAIEFTIRNGRTGNMPAQQHVLNPAEIAIAANYVLSLSRQ